MSPFRFLKILLTYADPFAVEDAQRRLRQCDIFASDHLLARLYVMRGSLDTFVGRILDYAGTSDARIDDTMLRSLAEADISKGGVHWNPRLVHPVGWLANLVFWIALLCSLIIVLGMTTFEHLTGWFWVAAGVVFGTWFLLSLVYIVVGSRFGRTTADRCIAIMLVAAGGCVFLIRGFA